MKYNPIRGLFCKCLSANDENLPTIGLDNPTSMHSKPSAGENKVFKAMSLNWKRFHGLSWATKEKCVSIKTIPPTLSNFAISVATIYGIAKCSKQALE